MKTRTTDVNRCQRCWKGSLFSLLLFDRINIQFILLSWGVCFCYFVSLSSRQYVEALELWFFLSFIFQRCSPSFYKSVRGVFERAVSNNTGLLEQCHSSKIKLIKKTAVTNIPCISNKYINDKYANVLFLLGFVNMAGIDLHPFLTQILKN